MIAEEQDFQDDETINREVDVRIVNVRFPRGKKSLIGLVDIALVVSGIEIIIANLTVNRNGDAIRIDGPKYRDPSGITRDVIIVPDAVNQVVADLIFSMFIEVTGHESVH